ncbi:hypothetical protein SAMN05216490_3176 [Mucilaginibacter mallensis]|uniref:Trehalase n=2 Tax=Mucilaginibacter mallensis TaxID=652787 RepID=A0A1H1ZMW2_MUCMA|nr:hypothetical protein SAMN05216490_3176 [Mucilaginibacter mallensis]
MVKPRWMFHYNYMMNRATMRKFILTLVLIISCGLVYAQNNNLQFKSADTALQTAFQRAKVMALHYKGKPGDPVGPWYESALPPRFAFCMRDVSHQSIGAEVLGLDKENKNMLTLFVKNISANKDWCTYWEINHFGKPAPEDYKDDKHFWFNLNANFDIMNACWNLYLWTGDQEYIKGAAFKNFYEKTANEYIKTWILEPDSLLTRPAHPNVTLPYDSEDAKKRCRGLPSYSEGVQNIKMGADLIAAIYRGLLSYAEILKVNGENMKALAVLKNAEKYRQALDSKWWDENDQLYYTYFTSDNKFGKTEGETFLLWFDAIKDPVRKQKTIQHLLNNNWNIENLSYFPYILYVNGYPDQAYNYMLKLTDPKTDRREYPEVSFGVIKGFTEGLMGISADARVNRLTTLYRNTADISSTLMSVPVLHTTIDLTHKDRKTSTITNVGKIAIQWRPKFAGNYASIFIDGKRLKATHEKNWLGNQFSYANVSLKAGQKITALVK